jgi:hypothetical protein
MMYATEPVDAHPYRHVVEQRLSREQVKKLCHGHACPREAAKEAPRDPEVGGPHAFFGFGGSGGAEGVGGIGSGGQTWGGYGQ